MESAPIWVTYLEHSTGANIAQQISPLPCGELVTPATQLVLAHFGVAIRSPEQYEGQQDEQFPASGLHESVMTQHSIVDRIQSHPSRLSESSSHERTALRHRKTCVENFFQIDVVQYLPPCVEIG